MDHCLYKRWPLAFCSHKIFISRNERFHSHQMQYLGGKDSLTGTLPPFNFQWPLEIIKAG